MDEKRLAHMKSLYPKTNVTTDYDSLVNDPSIDAIAVCTHVSAHYPLAKKALEAGKNVLVEKPLTASVEEAEELVALAKANGKVLMVDHTFEYTAGVNKMKEIIESGLLGDVLYVNCSRLNLGIFQRDINVVWDLAPHDLSVILYATGLKPKSIRTVGMKLLAPEGRRYGFCHLECGDNASAVIHVSWVDPLRSAKSALSGPSRCWSTMTSTRWLRFRSTTRALRTRRTMIHSASSCAPIKYGDIHMPRLKEAEPLSVMCRHFLDCIETGATPRSDGKAACKWDAARRVGCFARRERCRD